MVVEPIAVPWVLARAGTPRVTGEEPKATTQAIDLVTQDPRIHEVPGRDEEDRTGAVPVATPADPDAVAIGDPDLIRDGFDGSRTRQSRSPLSGS